MLLYPFQLFPIRRMPRRPWRRQNWLEWACALRSRHPRPAAPARAPSAAQRVRSGGSTAPAAVGSTRCVSPVSMGDAGSTSTLSSGGLMPSLVGSGARRALRFILPILALTASPALGADHFLTIGGGDAPARNQVSDRKSTRLNS